MLLLSLPNLGGFTAPAERGAAPTTDIDLPIPVAALAVHVVDVGQGDGTIWLLPSGGAIVYDCGPPARSAAENAVVQELRRLGFKTGAALHALVSSHGHLDHIGGCEEVLAEYKVAHVYEAWYEGADSPRSYARFRDQVAAEGATVHTLAPASQVEGEQPFRRGERLVLPPGDEAAGVVAEVLWPPAFMGDSWDDIAKSSVAVRLSWGDVSFCFQGDLETAQEAALAATPTTCTLYLVGHHGSRHASSARWLGVIRPTHAVVSFGENGYGHPMPEALCRVQQAGAKVYATHRLGTVMAGTDGSGLSVDPGQPEAKDYCAAGASYWVSPGPTG